METLASASRPSTPVQQQQQQQQSRRQSRLVGCRPGSSERINPSRRSRVASPAAEVPPRVGGLSSTPGSRPPTTTASLAPLSPSDRVRRVLEPAVVDRVCDSVRAACGARDPLHVFTAAANKCPTFDGPAFKTALRTDLDISTVELSDLEVDLLIEALDGVDGSALAVEAVVGFVERGNAYLLERPLAREETVRKGRTRKARITTKGGHRRSRKQQAAEEAAMKRLQLRLQAATFGESPASMFKKFAGADNALDVDELKKMFRIKLHIPKVELSDQAIADFHAAVDVDRSGSIDVGELADFVEYGTAVFDPAFDRPGSPLADPAHGDDDDLSGGLKWGQRVAPTAAQVRRKNRRRRRRPAVALDPDKLKKLQGRLQAATFGDDPSRIFAKFDASGDGVLSVEEVRTLFRRELRIAATEFSDADVAAFVEAVDDDGSKTVSIDELADFVQFGAATFYADAAATREAAAANRSQSTTRPSAGWGERVSESVAATEARRARARSRVVSDEAISHLQRKLKNLVSETNAGNADPVAVLEAAARRHIGGAILFVTSSPSSSSSSSSKGEYLVFPLEAFLSLVRRDARVASADVTDADVRAIHGLLDRGGGGSVTPADVGDFILRGPEAFGKDPVTRVTGPLVAETLDAASIGRCLGALQARLQGRDDLQAHLRKLVGEKEKTVFQLVREDLDLDDVDLTDADLAWLAGMVAAQPPNTTTTTTTKKTTKPTDGALIVVDRYKLGFFLKRGAKAFHDDFIDMGLVRQTAKSTRAEVDRRTVEKKLAAMAAKSILKEGKSTRPPLKDDPIFPAPSRTLFAFLGEDDEEVEAAGAALRQLSPVDAVLFSTPEHLDGLRTLRRALVAHEEMGQRAAAALVLCEMGKFLAAMPLHRFHRAGAHRAVQLVLAGDSFRTASDLLSTLFEVHHPKCLQAKFDAARCYLAAAADDHHHHHDDDDDDNDDDDDDDDHLAPSASSAVRENALKQATKTLQHLRATIQGQFAEDRDTTLMAQCLLHIAVTLDRRDVQLRALEEAFHRALAHFDAPPGARSPPAEAHAAARVAWAQALKRRGMHKRALAQMNRAQALYDATLQPRPPPPLEAQPAPLASAPFPAPPEATPPIEPASDEPPLVITRMMTPAALACRRTRLLWHHENRPTADEDDPDDDDDESADR